MARTDIRVYAVINVGNLNPTEQQWLDLRSAARNKPLASAINAAARASQNFISDTKRSWGVGNVLKNTLVAFEIDQDNVAALQAILNAQATIRGVSGTAQQKFIGVLQAELREAAADLGYGAGPQAQMTVSIAGFGDRDTAIAQVQAYLAINSAVWHGVL